MVAVFYSVLSLYTQLSEVAKCIAVCYGAPNYYKVLRARAQHPLRKSPAEEYLVAKRCKFIMLLFLLCNGIMSMKSVVT